MIILISGVVLLTYKKPEKKAPAAAAPGNVAMASRSPHGAGRPRRKSDGDGEDEQAALRTGDEPEPEEVWQIGSTDASDDEDGALPHTPRSTRHRSASARSRGEGEEERMIGGEDEEEGECGGGGREGEEDASAIRRTSEERRVRPFVRDGGLRGGSGWFGRGV